MRFVPHCCGNGTPRPLTLMESAEVSYHDAMGRIDSTVADLRGEPAFDLSTFHRNRERWSEAIRRRGGL